MKNQRFLQLDSLHKGQWVICTSKKDTKVSRQKLRGVGVVNKKFYAHNWLIGQYEYDHNGKMCFFHCYGPLTDDYWWLDIEDFDIEATLPVKTRKGPLGVHS